MHVEFIGIMFDVGHEDRHVPLDKTSYTEHEVQYAVVVAHVVQAAEHASHRLVTAFEIV